MFRIQKLGSNLGRIEQVGHLGFSWSFGSIITRLRSAQAQGAGRL